MINKPELLSPAGSTDALRAAAAAGADAVYFGAKSFSNRARAKNFDDGELKDGIRFAHSCGMKCHITVNTRIRDRERDDILRLAEVILGGAEEERADALIVADFGVASLIREYYPSAVLHASTQTSLSSLHDCEELKKLGFSRLVLPREMSFEEIKELSAASPIETEMFIHGAHCVSLSGQCLMSYVMGGRSGNRGECAQPCRLSYTMGEGGGCLLSLADMCLAGRMKKVCSSGVASLKIEGRLKSASYVYAVTEIYRRLIDENRDADKNEIKALEEIFSRGFTSGYFDGRYRTMAAGKTVSAEEISETRAFKSAVNAKIAERQKKNVKKTAVSACLTLKPNAPAVLTMRCGDKSATAEGAVPTPAQGEGVSAEYACASISKLGDTPFELDSRDMRLECSEPLWLPRAALNELRRKAAAELSAILDSEKNVESTTNVKKSVRPVSVSDTAHRNTGKPRKTALFENPMILLDGGLEDTLRLFDCVYVPISSYGMVKGAHTACEHTYELAASLPALMPSDERVRSLIDTAIDAGCRRFLVHTVGQAAQVREAERCRGSELSVDFSYRTNITNSMAARVYDMYSPSDVYYSPELPSAAAAKMGGSTIAYGRLVLMTMSSCLIARANGKCREGRLGGRLCGGDRANETWHSCRGYLYDRKKERFPVMSDSDCVNYIYNSVPIWMGDRMSAFDGCGSVMFCFTDESAEETAEIMRAVVNGEAREGRRI